MLIGWNEKLSFSVLFLMIKIFGWFVKLFKGSFKVYLLIEGVVKLLLNSVLGLGIRVFFLLNNMNFFWIIN